jgi:osmotically-inducible protein OsmY
MIRLIPVAVRALLLAFALGWASGASAIVSGAVAGKAISTAIDMRSVDEVKIDTEVDAALMAKFAAEQGDAFKSISVLVFAERAVLVGFAPNAEVRQRAEAIVRSDSRIHRFKDLVLIGPGKGSTAANAALDAKLNTVLTTTAGVHSVNMRWKVFGGDVFVMGVVESPREAENAIATIKGVSGVTAVHSALEVGKT